MRNRRPSLRAQADALECSVYNSKGIQFLGLTLTGKPIFSTHCRERVVTFEVKETP